MDLCGMPNPHGVTCQRPKGHAGKHRAQDQLCEPVFTIKARDRFALAIIRCWIATAKTHGVNLEKINGAEQIYKNFADWQGEHGTKLPD